MKKLFVLLVSVFTIYIAVVVVGLHRDSSAIQLHLASVMIDAGFYEEAVPFINKAARVDVDNGRLGDGRAQLIQVFVYSSKKYGQEVDRKKALSALYLSIASGIEFAVFLDSFFAYHSFLTLDSLWDREGLIEYIGRDQYHSRMQGHIEDYRVFHEHFSLPFNLDLEGYRMEMGLIN